MANGEFQHQDFRFLAQNGVRSNTYTTGKRCRSNRLDWMEGRPDIVLCKKSKILVLVLTVCHETNLQKSKLFILGKYENIGNCLQREFTHVPVSLFTVEVSVLGFVSDLKTFTKAAELPDLTTTTRSALSMKAITSSYDIYKQRNCPSISELNPTPEEC